LGGLSEVVGIIQVPQATSDSGHHSGVRAFSSRKVIWKGYGKVELATAAKRIIKKNMEDDLVS